MHLLNVISRLLFNISPKLIGPKFFHVKTHDAKVNNINIRIYTPNNIKEAKPIILYYHGGGWVIGSIMAYDRILRYMSYNTDYIVVAIEYRKAPQCKYPIALEDSYTGYRWVVNNIAKINGDINRLILCGDSAGGNLTLGLLRMLDKTDIRPYLAVLIYPLLEVKITSGSKIKKFDIVHKASDKILKYCLSQYLVSYSEQSAYISFIDNFAKDITYPKTLIITAQLDALTIGINKYANELKSIGADVIIKEYSGLFHGFINFSGVSKQAKSALDDIISYIKYSIY